MADSPNAPMGALPPKPAEAAKVQPKKETVRISLPPKAAAKETVRLNIPPKPTAPPVRLPGTAPSINLIVPQVTEVDSSVPIPSAVPEVQTAAQPHKQVLTHLPSPSPAPPEQKPGSLVPPVPADSKTAEKLAPKKGVKPVAAPVPMVAAGGSRIGFMAVTLACLAAIAGVAAVVRLLMIAQPPS